MINCPKCQVPNPDNTPQCMACGAPLGAPQQPAGIAPTPQMQPQFSQQQFGQPQFGQPMNAAAAQAELHAFAAEMAAKKRTKRLVYMSILVVAIMVFGFILWQRSRKQEIVKKTAEFFLAYKKIDNENIGDFWKCTVRAKHKEIHLAQDTLEVTDGLEKAFANFPSTQPDTLRDKCLPMLDAALEEYNKLQTPPGFAEPLEGAKAVLKDIKDVFAAYAAKLDLRKQDATAEQKIRDAHGQFHNYLENKDAPLAPGYYKMLKCAIPDLQKKLKAVTKRPDTQPVVEYVYNTCKENPKYADAFRKQCFGEVEKKEDPKAEFRVAVDVMAGDTRDLEALNDCFRRANEGFSHKEINDVAQVFIKYNNARGAIIMQVDKVKKELKQ